MTTFSTRLLGIGALCLLTAANASAQGGVTPALDGAVLRPAVDTFYQIERGDTTARMIQSLRRVTHGRRSAWLQVFVARGRDYITVDSTEMDSQTLLPIVEARATPAGAVRVRYSNSMLHAVVTSKGARPQTIDLTLAAPVYASSTLDAIARALPLRAGFTTSEPFYYPFPATIGLAQDSYRVVGSTVVLDRHRLAVPCWIVDFVPAGQNGRTRFYVDKATRTVVTFGTSDGVTYER